uniref:Uncharacterized protein n=1 Tax=Kryptolebias marmoratus TaxID=37003 RepID=A0A3Q3BEN3_KRYMA
MWFVFTVKYVHLLIPMLNFSLKMCFLIPFVHGKADSHYEKLNFRLKKQHVGDPITGLLLIYPSCLLQVIEVNFYVPEVGCLFFLQSSGIVFIAHNLQSRLFQKWSYKVSFLPVRLCLKVLPGSVLDETPELIVPEKILEKLLGRDELITPQQYLQMYQSPLKISIEFGEKNLLISHVLLKCQTLVLRATILQVLLVSLLQHT